MHRRLLLAVLLLPLLTPHSSAADPPHGLRLPPGFEVGEFAGSDLANDIYCMTLDPRGRVVVSGRGYIRLLLDEDGDGRADRVLDFTGAPKDGAMGLFWEGDELYCVGDGGLRRYRDANGKGRLNPPELLVPLRTGGEHAAHAVRRGPDGWLYLLCGNFTDIKARHATLPTSPIREPVAGCLLRFPPDFHGCEIIADGFRNAYAFDFNADGEVFTYDSDNERCVSLPWYEYTRCYHVIPGGHHGWLAPQQAQTWRLPPYFLDVIPPLTTLGRGSPTGVVCYRHVQFPEHYRGGLFLCDWTFGRIHFVELQRHGTSYTSRSEVFLQAAGENGFAPTAAAVHPTTGDLYVSIGGRGTRGAVYRIRYPAGLTAVKAEGVARLQPAPRSLDWDARQKSFLLTQATDAEPLNRLHALHLLRRHHEHFSVQEVARAVDANAGQADRLLRQAAAALLECLPAEEQKRLARTDDPLRQTTFGLAHPDLAAARLLTDRAISPAVRLDAVRLVQLALGGVTARQALGTVWEGYSRRHEGAVPTDLRDTLRGAFPSDQADLDRELSRTLAMLEDDDAALLGRVANKLTADSSPIEDLHYLIVLARLKGPRSAALTHQTASALLALDTKIARRGLTRDRHWPLRVAELHAELSRKDPALNAALLGDPAFGRPDHARFAHCPGFDRRRAAEVFLARAGRIRDFAWNAELIGLLGELPEERARPVLRGLWGEQGLDEEILAVLARHPAEEDRDRFRSALGSAQPATVRLALSALERLQPLAADADEILALLLALRRLPPDKETDDLRRRLTAYLKQVAGRKAAGVDDWEKWFRATYPARAARLGDSDGADRSAWARRLAAVDWSAGDAGRGRIVFTRASCASCHSGAQALGPDLRGVAGRFSRTDLFTAILQPSKDVSPRYRTTQVATADGKVYQGLIVYEAVDSLILQTGPAATLRLTAPQIRERRQTATSLMPAGLLDRLTDRDLADLYAYLRELKPGGARP
jgi:putative membrane-bound dehydrogenase-like protein